MGMRKSARKARYEEQNNNNVVEFEAYRKKRQVTILPRNKNQETYLLKLLDNSKDIVFGIGPAGTGKTLIAVKVAVKLLKEGAVDKIIVTRPAVSVDEDLGFVNNSNASLACCGVLIPSTLANISSTAFFLNSGLTLKLLSL